MAADERWYFTKEQIQNTPSRKCGFDADKELSYRQQAANFIQDMGQKLQVTQLCINTAIVYMHRFYMFHSFTHFPWNTIAAASFFLAAKVEEQPRKLEHVIRATNVCLHRDQGASFDVKSEQYAAQSQELVFNENVLLQTLGFDVAIDHPHTHVVRCCHLVKASKDLAQTSYFMASNSLHLTTMCLQYKPTVVACFCIHLACKWSNWQIPKSNEGRDWFYYVDRTVTSELLEQLTTEFLVIFDKCPSRLKRKILSISSNNPHGPTTDGHSTNYSPSDFEPKRINPEKFTYDPMKTSDDHKKRGPDGSQRVDYREYKEKKERERYEREKQQLHAGSKQPVPGSKAPPGAPLNKPVPNHNHHRPPIPNNNDPNKMKMHHRPTRESQQPDNGNNRRDNEVNVHRDQTGGQIREYNREVNGTREGLHREHHSRDLLNNKDAVQKRLVDSENKVIENSDKRFDNNRQKIVDPKLLNKHDPNRIYQKRPDTVPISDNKKLVNQHNQDKNNYLINKNNSTSQRHKSPFDQKSVPQQQNYNQKPVSENNKNGSHNLNLLNDKAWIDNQIANLEDPTPPVKTRQPSLFSPEKTSPPKKISSTPPNVNVNVPNEKTQNLPKPISPFTSPPPKSTPEITSRRHRNSSSSSEPELRPVVKKLDQISGFENIIRDSKMGIKLPKVPDIIQPICDRNSQPIANDSGLLWKDLKPPEIIKPFNTLENLSQPIVNGIETDPTLISNLLKENPAPAITHLPVIEKIEEKPIIPEIPTEVEKVKEHHHKSEKKKKKDKHKHKDKDKSKEEKKKHKHKDKDREKHKKVDVPPEEITPLKITIPKEKIPQLSSGLKVKISKDRLQPETAATPEKPPSLKIKISKDSIQYNSVNDSSKKRERERDHSNTSPNIGPPTKMLKTSYRQDSNTQNGRNSYNK